jgi:hypothetical protein
MSRLLVLPALLSCAACVGPWYDYSFAPAPQEARVVDDALPGSQARTLITIAGIRRPVDHEPARVEAGIRIDNLGTTPVRLVPESVELATADLSAFLPTSIQPAAALELAPGEARTFAIAFDLPPGAEPKDYAFDGIALKFGLDFGRGAAVETSMSFERAYLYPDSPRVHTSIGVGYVFH